MVGTQACDYKIPEVDDLAVGVQVVVPCLIGGGDTHLQTFQIGEQALIQEILTALVEIDYGIARDMLELKIRLGSEQLTPKQFVRTRPLHGFVLGRGINDHLYEGRFTPRVNGKRISKNVYAKTREECEEKLAELIKTMKAEIAEMKKATNA